MSAFTESDAGQRLDPMEPLLGLIRRQRARMAMRAARRVRYQPIPRKALEARYLYSGAASKAESFVLYRIIGNDLTPRHAKGQSRANVGFILEHEPQLPDCEKRWIINRISDPEEEALIIALLEQHDQPYVRIPFEPNAYRALLWDSAGSPFPRGPLDRRGLSEDAQERFEMHLRRLKNLYAMNNNGARNAALAEGRARAKWVLPFDGNCFFTAAAFDEVRRTVCGDPIYPYVIVPMARVSDNEALLDDGYEPQAVEEPQIAFRFDAIETFDERVPYGRRPKVELLWRLGVRGGWDKYLFDAWDLPRPPLAGEKGGFNKAGWVARLDSGRADLETGKRSFLNRGAERNRSIIARLDRLDEEVLAPIIDPDALSFYSERAIHDVSSTDPVLANQLRAEADGWLSKGPWSVMDKTTLPPSQDRHDYWHPAPYWWPDPRKPDGLPYVQKDGMRVPGTILYEEGCERYDRTSLQNMFDATVGLALAATALGQAAYGVHAARILAAWFIDPSTRMNPHLDYSQVRLGHNGNRNTGTGLIEFRDIAFLFDAIRLLVGGGYLSTEQVGLLKDWFSAYADWIETSEAGRNECRSSNNHGTFYDVQLVSLGLFLNRPRLASLARNRSIVRLAAQLAPDGKQPHELRRDIPRHYCAFNLTGWSILARLLAGLDCDLWKWRDAEGRSLRRAVEWLATTETHGWAGNEAFDPERLAPLWREYRRHYVDGSLPADGLASTGKPCFHSETGLPRYWTLGGVE